MAKAKNKRKSKGRPKQPKCKSCGKSLYKRMDTGQVLKTDPYAWCRNKDCKKYNQDQSGKSRFKPLGDDAVKKSQTAGYWDAIRGKGKEGSKEPPPAKPSKPKSLPMATPPVLVEPKEPEPVRKARARIREVMEATEAQFGPNTIGLALAIVSQETGNHEAANSLIREYNLTKLYGIQPR